MIEWIGGRPDDICVQDVSGLLLSILNERTLVQMKQAIYDHFNE